MIYRYILIRVLITILFSTLIYAENKPFSYSYIPKFVYKNQVFPVTVLVKHYDKNDPPHFEYDIVGELQPLSSKPIRVINQNEAFFTFYFKANNPYDNSITIPQLSIWNLTYTYLIQPKIIELRDLDTSKIKDFSNLLASNLRVTNVKIDPFDNKNSLVTLKLEATEANLEDFKIPNVSNDGIENLKRDGAKVIANYYFTIPSKVDNISFSYFNLIKNKFESKTINTSIKKGFSQKNYLAPKDLTFDTLKKYTLYALTFIFLLLLLWTKDLLYLIISFILLSLNIYNFLQEKSICVKEGASIYILPTSNSNISRELNKKIKTKLIKKYKNFNKIEYKNIIGWVKDEDLCKN